jgi:hypothetical protein
MSVVDKLNAIDEIIEALKICEKRLDEIVYRFDWGVTKSVEGALVAHCIAGNELKQGNPWEG